MNEKVTGKTLFSRASASRQAGRLLDWIYPKRAVCMGCGAACGFEEDWLCGDCLKQLAQNRQGLFSDDLLDGCAAAYIYRGPAGSVVRKFKYSGVKELAEPMAESMLRACDSEAFFCVDIVTAVPMHPKRLRKRGFNPADLLAKCAAKQLGLPYESLLVRTRNTPQQAKLEKKDRKENLKGSIQATTTLQGSRVLLIDDVYTTGETAHTCAEALRRAGAASVRFLAYAKSG